MPQWHQGGEPRDDGRPWGSVSPHLPVLHPQWGIFGSRAGSPLLLTIRAVLFVEFIAAMLLAREVPILQFLASASFGVVMMLSLIHVAGTSHFIGR